MIGSFRSFWHIFWWAWIDRGWHPVLAAGLALAVSALLGFAMNEYGYEPLRRRGTKGLGFLITTLALLTLGTAIIILVFGSAPKSFQYETPTIVLGPIRLTLLQGWILGVTAILLAVFYFIIQRTKFGQALRACADHEIMAEILGIDTKKIRRWCFVLSSLLAAPAGILLGLEFNLDPNMGITLAVLGFSAAVIGGVGTFFGPLVGALIIGITEQVAVWYGGAGWKHAIAFLLLFVFLLIRPSGLVGRRKYF